MSTTTATWSNTDSNVIFYPSEFKMNVNMEAIDGYHMADVDFTCHFFVKKSQVVSLTKSQMIMIDEDNYVAPLSSSDLGKGNLIVRYEADIPDEDFDDDNRFEAVEIKTQLKIV